MSINWDEITKALLPIKDYEDLCARFQKSFSYSFVRELYNFTLPGLIDYTRDLLGGDSRGRYHAYGSELTDIIGELNGSGVKNILDLVVRVNTREKLVMFTERSGVNAKKVAALLKYLVYWVVPLEKYLSGLIQDDVTLLEAIKLLRATGVRTNLDLLQQGRCEAGRKSLACASGLPEAVIVELVNRADFSRLPWASKATLSNIIGAGYGSLRRLANADPEQLYADFLRYGKSIGKNLKLGNEIENSCRIAKILPVVLKEE